MTPDARGPVISLMLAVADASAAAKWYLEALGATELWNMGGVVGLSVEGAPFFLGEPADNGWNTPAEAGTRTVRVELFVDDPDSFVRRALAAGADGSLDGIEDHERPWGVHRQGGFTDPFGHLWLVGDKSPLSPH
jgi:PhnB protein